MNNNTKKDIAGHTIYAAMVIIVSFFLTQTYSPLFTTTNGILIIALATLGSFLCGKTYGITTGVILSIFILTMRTVNEIEGFSLDGQAAWRKGQLERTKRKLKEAEVLLKKVESGGYTVKEAQDKARQLATTYSKNCSVYTREKGVRRDKLLTGTLGGGSTIQLPSNADKNNLETWVSPGVVKQLEKEQLKNHYELMVYFYNEKWVCAMVPLYRAIQNDPQADKKMIDVVKKQVTFLKEYVSDWDAEAAKAEVKANVGLSKDQLEIKKYANMARELKFNDNSDGKAFVRFTTVNKQTTVAAAKEAYEKIFKEYLAEAAANKLEKMKWAIKSRDLPFPITNSTVAQQYRYDITLNKPTTGQAKWAYERDFEPASKREITQEKQILAEKEKAGNDMKKIKEEIAAAEAGLKKQREAVEKELEEARANAEKIRQDAIDAQKEAERLAEIRAEEIRRIAGEEAGVLAAKIKKEAEEAAAVQRLAAEENADLIRQEAAAAAASAKAISDAEKLRLEKYEIEVKAERENANTQKLLAERAMAASKSRQIELDQLIEGSKNASNNFQRQLAIARERAQRAELSIDVERERGDAAKRKEVARCSAEKAKAEERRRRQEQIRINRAQLKAAEERAKIAAAKTERERIDTIRRLRAKELADERRNQLRELRTGLIESRQIQDNENQMMQVATTSDSLASQSQKGSGLGNSMYSSGPASTLGPDGMPSQFSIDNLYRDRSTNSYLNRGAADNIYVDRSTLGGYMGPMNYELYANAKQIPK